MNSDSSRKAISSSSDSRFSTPTWGVRAAVLLSAVVLVPLQAAATTPYPRLLLRAEGEPDFDIEAAVEMVDDGTSGDDVAGDGLYTAEVSIPEDGGAAGPPQVLHYRIVPPDTLPEEAIGDATGDDVSIALPDGEERTIRFFYSTARATEIPSTPECPDEETRLSCLGFAPIPGISDDWNTAGTAAAIGDHQADLGGTAWDPNSTLVRLQDDPVVGPARRIFSFLSGRGWSAEDGWQPAFETPDGPLRLGPDGWYPAGGDPGSPFDLEAPAWRVVRFEVLPHRGMARQTIETGDLPKPLLTEIVTDAAAPFVEVHNPAAHPLALAGLHLTNHPGYPTLGVSPSEVDASGFVVRFPEGRHAGPGAWLTVSLVDASVFESAWGRPPDYVLPGASGPTALEPAYSTPSAVGASPALDEAGGFVGLLHHLDPEERVLDVDLVVWGSPEAGRELPDKSGVSAGSETYGQDSMRAASSPAPAGPYMARRDFDEGSQRVGAAYNGLFDPGVGGRHDETDEPVSETWALASAPTPGEPPDEFRFHVSGHVTEESSGDPIGGAQVAALPGGPTATTEDDGSYLMEIAAGAWTLEASAEGYVSRSREVNVDGDIVEDFELESEIGAVVGGRVRDDLDRWMAGVSVDLVGGQRSRNETTGADGGFTFTGVLPGTYTITASMEGYRSDSRNLSIGEDDLFDVILTLTYVPVSYALYGRVVDGGTDEPVAGALLSIPSLEATTTSDRDGEFVFRLLPPDTYTLTARAEGYAESVVEVTVDDADVEDVEIRLGRDGDALTLTGTVTIAGLDMPISGARVTLTCPEGVVRESTTDHRGMYVILGLSPGRYELTITAGGYSPHHEVLDLEAPTEHDVALERPPGQGFSLSGIVRLEGRADGDWAGATVTVSLPEIPDDPMVEARTTSDGGYLFEDLAPGRYRLLASRSGYVSAGMTVELASDRVQHFVLHADPDADGNGFLGCDCTSATPSSALMALLLAAFGWAVSAHRRPRARTSRVEPLGAS